MANEELREVLDSLDIAAYLDAEGITYKERRGSSGMQLNIKECPACATAKWKVYLNAETGLGNCFSGDCETKFNKWSFIKAHNGGLTDRQVVDHIKQAAKDQGWRAPRVAAAAVELPDLELPACMPLPINGRNLHYLENRGISNDIARYFNLAYCQRGSFAGLDFSSRIIIPIFDLDGKLVSFQGRDITGTAERKYLFPPGYASTGAHLFNGQNVHSTKRVALGEGAFDVMAMKVAFDGEAALRDVIPIGSFGKTLAAVQIDRLMDLKRAGVEEITFMWDAEEQALADAVHAGILLKSYGFVARIAVLPPGKDPNEVPAEVVRQAYWRAEVVSPAIGARLLLALRAG